MVREAFRPWIRDPGWKKFEIRIRDKHPGSATLLRRRLRIWSVFILIIQLLLVFTSYYVRSLMSKHKARNQSD
jgi:hypothetical protein